MPILSYLHQFFNAEQGGMFGIHVKMCHKPQVDEKQ